MKNFLVLLSVVILTTPSFAKTVEVESSFAKVSGFDVFKFAADRKFKGYF